MNLLSMSRMQNRLTVMVTAPRAQGTLEQGSSTMEPYHKQWHEEQRKLPDLAPAHVCFEVLAELEPRSSVCQIIEQLWPILLSRQQAALAATYLGPGGLSMRVLLGAF